MADNKQYVTQIQDSGTIMISEEVITTIVAQAVAEVEGIVGLGVKSGTELVDKHNKRNWGKSIKVKINDRDEVSVDCNVVVGYGQSVVAIAKGVQKAIRSALEAAGNVTVGAVNVNVCGIIRQ